MHCVFEQLAHIHTQACQQLVGLVGKIWVKHHQWVQLAGRHLPRNSVRALLATFTLLKPDNQTRCFAALLSEAASACVCLSHCSASSFDSCSVCCMLCTCVWHCSGPSSFISSDDWAVILQTWPASVSNRNLEHWGQVRGHCNDWQCAEPWAPQPNHQSYAARFWAIGSGGRCLFLFRPAKPCS